MEASRGGGAESGNLSCVRTRDLRVCYNVLQAIVGQEVEAAVARILDFQVDAFGAWVGVVCIGPGLGMARGCYPDPTERLPKYFLILGRQA